MFNKIEALGLITALFGIIPLSWSQVTRTTQSHSDDATTGWYSDYEVDYYPSIKNCNWFPRGIPSEENGSAFKESIEQRLKGCTGKDYSLERYSGIYTRHSGIEPKYLRENPCIYLNISATGSIRSISINNLDQNREVGNCIKQSLENCQVHPALKNGQKVNSSWIFLIHKN